MSYINGLNTLRAFAVFFVFIQHFGTWFDETSPSGKFIRYIVIPGGGYGVRLFFVLSGFLITSILLHAKKTEQGYGAFNIIRNFFIRRALRIFPIYYLLLFILYILDQPDIRHYFWYYATYTSNILSYRNNEWNNYSHTWTLSVEEQFYLLWPWLMILIKDKYLKYVFIGAIVTGIVSTYISENVTGNKNLLMFHSLDAFGIGGLYALAQFNDQHRRRFERVVKILVIPALGLCYYWNLALTYQWPINSIYLIKTTESIVSIWLIMLVVNNKSVWVGKYFLGNRFLNYMGKISYGIYLFHYPYIAFSYGKISAFMNHATAQHPTLNKIINDRHINYWMHLSIIIIVAAISFELIEKPILNLKKRFAYSRRRNILNLQVWKTQ